VWILCTPQSCYTNQLRSALTLVGACLLLCAPAWTLDPERSLDQFSYQTWQTGSGLPQNSAHSILQSRDGFLWIATEGGLVRFDGYEFVVYDTRNTPALQSNNINALLEDADGSLWIATAAALCRRRGERIEAAPGRSANIMALHRDRSGAVWAVTPDGCERRSLDPGRAPERFTLPEGSPRLTGAMAFDAAGKIWLGTEAGIRIWQNGRFLDLAAQLPVGRVASLLLDRSGRLWVGTSRGAFVSDIAAPRVKGVFKPVCDATGSSSVAALFEDWERSIWIGADSGVYRLLPNSECQPARTLNGAPVLALTEDAEGDLWVGTESAGVTIVRNQKFVTYTVRDGLSADAVRCVLKDRAGSTWVGTSAGLTQISASAFTRYTTADGLSSNVVLSLGEDASGDLLIGTPDGLNRMHNGVFTLTTSADGLPDDFVRALYTDTDGSLWVGTRRGLSHRQNASHFTNYSQANGLGNDLVGAMLRGREGGLWIATLGGLSVFRNGRLQNFGTRDGLSSNVVTALYEDADGDLWIGTQDAGLNLRSRSRIAAIPQRFGLPNPIFGITEDANGELWIPSKNGIARVNRTALKNAIHNGARNLNVVWYNTSDGLRVNECSIGGHPEVWKAHDGSLWFSTLKGVAMLSRSAAQLNHVLPPVQIESVQIDNRFTSPADKIDVKPGPSRFAFTYAALSFAAPQKVIYRYQLEGFDKDWVEAGAERVAYYTNIPPGSYRFRVVARNNDGFWNQAGALVAFRLAPPFHQTFWFYALCALALAAGCYGIYGWRVAEIESRFQAVLQERNRIGREIHDTLAQSFVAVSMQLEIVSRLLTSSTETAREHLDQARTQVREGLKEARRSIWQLRSQSSESEDLAARVSKAAQQSIGLNPVKLRFEVLRISQEAVTNALRHAHPQNIRIELAYAAKRLRMTIADDGCGFTPGDSTPGPNGHFGLKGMRERAEQINANLSVDSAAGKGTKVQVEAMLS
jgi:ligand-binding sensor domain-containing protein/two-component sensor histidine kinase